MAEIVNDIKVDLIEAVGSLGITLSSEDTRIKHIKSGTFEISSNGSIEINGGNGGVGNDGGYVKINGGIGGNNGFGGNIEIIGGTGVNGSNVQGGNITIEGGHAEGTENGGEISITGGQGGTSTVGGRVFITGGSSTGNENGADLIISGGGGGNTGREGRVICESLFRVRVFFNNDARNAAATATIGDICFVENGSTIENNNKLQVYTGSGWAFCN